MSGHLKSAEHGGCVRWCPECERRAGVAPVAATPTRCNATWGGGDGDMHYVCSLDHPHAGPHRRNDANGELRQFWRDGGEHCTPHVPSPDKTFTAITDKYNAAYLRHTCKLREGHESLHFERSGSGALDDMTATAALLRAEVARLNAEVEKNRVDLRTWSDEVKRIARERDAYFGGMRLAHEEIERIAAERDDAREQLADDTHHSWVESAIRDGNEVKRLRTLLTEIGELNSKAATLAAGGAE